MLLYNCGEQFPTFSNRTYKMLLSEQLREIINRMEESDRKTQELLEASAKRFKEKLAELDKLNKQFD